MICAWFGEAPNVRRYRGAASSPARMIGVAFVDRHEFGANAADDTVSVMENLVHESSAFPDCVLSLYRKAWSPIAGGLIQAVSTVPMAFDAPAGVTMLLGGNSIFVVKPET